MHFNQLKIVIKCHLLIDSLPARPPVAAVGDGNEDDGEDEGRPSDGHRNDGRRFGGELKKGVFFQIRLCQLV